MTLLPRSPDLNEAAIWQDVEFGSYAADLPLWRELARETGGPVLEVGAGSGRVALDLAAEGAEVVAIDVDETLVAELGARAEGTTARALVADVTSLDREELEGFALAIAPLQVIQLLDGPARADALTGLAASLRPGGRLAAALVDEGTLSEEATAAQIRPDMREVEGWVYCSEPLWVQVSEDRLRMRRLRDRVSPRGDQTRRVHDDVLYRVSPQELELEAEAAGLRPLERRTVASSDYEAGSVVVILERP